MSRTGSDCIVSAKVVPEHKISKKLYTVTCKIDEQNDSIIYATCEDCPASAGIFITNIIEILRYHLSEPVLTYTICFYRRLQAFSFTIILVGKQK